MDYYKKSIVLIIFFCFSISCNLSKNSETEPNNTFTTANSIEINKEIFGYIDSENDIDNFILDITEDQILRIELSAVKGINTAIYLYRNENPRPLLIKVVDDNRKSAPEVFANLFVQQGQYIISITHGNRDIKKGNSETPYKLLVSSRSFLNEEKEPDDNPGTANEIFDKSSISGFFSPGQNSLNNDSNNKMKETDWYKFNVNLNNSEPVLIDLKLSGVNGVDSVITLFNSGMEELITIDNAGSGEGETLSDFGIKESGTYYLEISSKNFLFNNDIPYELKLDYKAFDLNSELESNNSFEKANMLVNNIINGKISGSGDVDYYQFTPAFKNRYYRAKCVSSEGLDVVMKIYDNNRNKLFEINNTGAGETETIPFFLIRNSVYISIYASSISAPESSYSLEFEQYDSSDILEQEPNNTKTTANLINKKITGFITYKNDMDYYMIKYPERQKVKIYVKGVRDGKIRISTTDPLGFIIKSKEVNSDDEISFSEVFDKKGFIIVEPVIMNYQYPYTITIEDL